MTRENNSRDAASNESSAAVMSALLSIHSAITADWLVDATSAAADRVLNAAYTFVYFEDHAGRLERKRAASDITRRGQQRAIDAFGPRALGQRLDPKDAPAIAEALDGRRLAITTPADLFGGLVDEASAAAAQSQLGVSHAALAPLESAGERIGALLVLSTEPPSPDSLRAFADHVACATVNLRQSQAAREQGEIDVVRSVFDARKLETDLQRELGRTQRYQRQLSIVVVEATNVRLLRETFGRFLADRLLQRLGEALAENARDFDVIGAYKESGYTMILTEASAEVAALAARRFSRIARDVRLDADAVPGLELHMAFGWATAPGDGTTSDALFAAAERRMYDPAQQVA